jgi:hypothetical protein
LGRGAGVKSISGGAREADRKKFSLSTVVATRARRKKITSRLNVHERPCRVRSTPNESSQRGERSGTVMHLLLLRSLFREMVTDLAGRAPTADEPTRGGMTRYLIVVARTEPAVYEHLRNRHSGDAKVRVMLDRRGASDVDTMERPPAERRRRRSSLMAGASHELVAIAPEYTPEPRAPHPQPLESHEEAPRQMSQIETIDDAQRTTRWLAESQYQLSHVIPLLVDERDRLRRALEEREQECERLGGELGELRRIHGALQGELDALRSERSAMAEAFGGVVGLLGQLQRPLSDIAHRLQTAQPIGLARD